jgi:hypothetical protein
MAYDHAMMLDDSNQFAFTCPNFGAEVQARVCFKLHNLFMVGKPHEKRKGCSACMAANKCPVAHMVKEQLKEGDNRYYSDTPKTGRLSAAVLQRIKPLAVLDSIYANYAVNTAERQAIEAASGISDDKGSHRRTVEIDDVHIHHEPKPRRQIAKSPKREEAKEEDTTVTAAISGDMSAALTAATAALPHKGLLDRIPPEKREEIRAKVAAQSDEQEVDGALRGTKTKATKPAAPAKGLSLLELAKRKKEASV